MWFPLRHHALDLPRSCAIYNDTELHIGCRWENGILSKSRDRLDRLFDRLERRIPRLAANWLARVRRPEARWVRIPLGILLVLGGIFSFLPVLGIWMLPLGLLLLALDLMFLQGPVNMAILRGGRKWTSWQRARRNKKNGQA